MASDWATRSTRSTVLRAFRLDSQHDLGPNWVPDPIRQGNWGWDNQYGIQAYPPRIDNTVTCEGSNGALLFTLPPNGNASCGQWGCRFTDNNTTVIAPQGEGSVNSVYMQERIRWDANLYNTTYLANVDTNEIQGGIKFFDLQKTDGSTSDDLKQVVVTYYQQRWPVMYNGPNSQGMQVPIAGNDFIMQNNIPTCLYHDGSGCIKIYPDEWMTFQLGIDLYQRVATNENYVDARVRLWLARDGLASALLFDWKPGQAGYFPLYFGPLAQHNTLGMLYNFPYMTSKDARQVTPLAKAWYANVIIDTQQIDDPAPSGSDSPKQADLTRRSRVKVT